LPFRLLDTPVLRRLDAPLGILSGFQTDQLTRHLQSSKTNASKKLQMFCGPLSGHRFVAAGAGLRMLGDGVYFFGGSDSEALAWAKQWHQPAWADPARAKKSWQPIDKVICNVH